MKKKNQSKKTDIKKCNQDMNIDSGPMASTTIFTKLFFISSFLIEFKF